MTCSQFNIVAQVMYSLTSVNLTFTGKCAANIIALPLQYRVKKPDSANEFSCGVFGAVYSTLIFSFQSTLFTRACKALFSPALSIRRCFTGIPFAFQE